MTDSPPLVVEWAECPSVIAQACSAVPTIAPPVGTANECGDQIRMLGAPLPTR
jgi:hypothetical protein